MATNNNELCDSNWKDVSTIENDNRKFEFRFIPAKKTGVCADITSNSTPLDCLFTLLTDDVMEDIVIMVNTYAIHKIQLNSPAHRRSTYNDWKPTNRYELLKCIAVLIAMGLDHRPSIKDYWSALPIYHSTFYKAMFTRPRFELLYHTMLHVSAIDSTSKDKIEPFINRLIEKFQQAFYPDKNVSVDEMVIGYKGRWKYKQYNASKPSKYHIKTFGLCDSNTGYVYNVLIYFGKDTSYLAENDFGMAEKVFDHLMQPLGTGHHIFADRYYTTHKLLQFLSSRKQYYTGTLNLNRKNFPLQIRGLKLDHRESKFYRNDNDGIICVAWWDKKAKKTCILVSTHEVVGHTSQKGKEKPVIVHTYNFNMNGCDRLDQCISYYGHYTRKTLKWWKRIFHWSLEVSQCNAHILFQKSRDADEATSTISLKQFKETLISELCNEAARIKPDKDIVGVPRVGRPRDNPLAKLTGNTHLIKYVTKDRQCVACSKKKIKRRTNYVCVGCPGEPHLHPKECFYSYHTMEKCIINSSFYLALVLYNK